MPTVVSSPYNPVAFHVIGVPAPDSSHPRLKKFYTALRSRSITNENRNRLNAAYNALRSALYREELLKSPIGIWLREQGELPIIMPEIPGENKHILVQFKDPKAAMLFKLAWVGI